MLNGFRDRAGDDTPEARAARLVAQKEQQAAARRKEADADKGSRLARNPRAQIAWRLEQRRQAEFEAEHPIEEHVPTHKAIIPGWRERYELVDVHAVRLKCRQLEPGVTVGALLEQRRVEDRRAAHAATITHSKSLPSALFGCEGSAVDTELSRRPSGTDPSAFLSRWQRVQAKKQATRVDKMLRRLHNMRGKPSEVELERFNILAQEVCVVGALDIEEKVGELVQEHPMRRSFLDTCAMHQELTIPSQIAASQEVVPAPRELSPDSSERKKKMRRINARMKLLILARARERRTQKHMQQWRGTVRTLCVYFAHMKRTEAVALAKTFLHDLTEFTQCKQAVRRLNKKVRMLTRACKAFAITRRLRLVRLHEAWQKVEDLHLEAYFQLFAKAAMEDEGKTKTQGRSRVERKQQVKMDFLKKIVHSELGWQKLRVPERERSAIVSRYYSAQLRKQVRRQKEVSSTVESALQQARWNQDIRRFVEEPVAPQIGRLEKRGSDRREGKAEPEVKWWGMSEETILDLIAFAVSGLKQVEPFSRHPSSGGIQLDSPMWNRSPAKGGELLVGSVHRRLGRKTVAEQALAAAGTTRPTLAGAARATLARTAMAEAVRAAHEAEGQAQQPKADKRASTTSSDQPVFDLPFRVSLARPRTASEITTRPTMTAARQASRAITKA